ncbi:glycosyltransferase family A protein, partial [Pseudanabaena sp. CCNP1317]|uniref:glycosyltransferase family A protein n=1 Tax=Pseudanabaena sp. CCNP1317 TaxID=3110253 RepID=UPI002B1FCB75
MSRDNAPGSLDVIIATRNRPDDLARVLESLVVQTWPAFRVIVVDQSDEPRANLTTIANIGDDRIQHVPTTSRGKSRALNEALITHSDAAVIAFTDDDCQMDARWLSEVMKSVERHSDAGMIFGTLVPIPHDPA